MRDSFRAIFTLSVTAVLALSALNARSEQAGGEETRPTARMTRLTERVWVCRLQYAQQKPKGYFPVIASKDGLIVVDTPMFPSEARAVRAAIVAELGRSDFLYLINTHHHWDHTMGNQFFPEAVIVGHAFTPVDMETFTGERFARFIAQRKEAARKGRITASPALIEELEREFQAAPPTKTFESEETIRLSDLSLILYHTGRDGAPVSLYNHTRSDIFIYIPEEKVLCAGDSFYDKEWLDAPPLNPPADLLNGFLTRRHERSYTIEHVVFGHDPWLTGNPSNQRR